MEVRERFAISFGVAFFLFFFKWFASNHVLTKQANRCCRKIPNPGASFGFWRGFRSLGFDLANASAGLLAIAYVLRCSNLWQLCERRGEYALLVAILCFAIFCVLYTTAVKLRYVYLEAAEGTSPNCFWSWLDGFLATLLGLFMLLGCSCLVVGAR